MNTLSTTCLLITFRCKMGLEITSSECLGQGTLQYLSKQHISVCHDITRSYSTYIRCAKNVRASNIRDPRPCCLSLCRYLLVFLQSESSAAVCAKRYCGILPRLRRMDIADTRVLCSAPRRWGRHTVNCRQNRKAESCEICILTATVHKSVKSHCLTRWYTEPGGCEGENKWRESEWWELERKNITEVFTVYVGNYTPSFYFH